MDVRPELTPGDSPRDSPDGRKVAWSMVYTGVGGVFGKIAFLIAIFIALKFMSRADLGVAQEVLALFAILAGLVELGLAPALIQVKQATPDQTRTLFWLSAVAACVAYVVIFLAAPWIADFYKNPELTQLVRAHGLVLPLSALFMVPRVLMMRDLTFGRITLIENGALAVSAIFMIGLAYQGFGPWALIGAELLNHGLQAVLYQLARPYLPAPSFAIGRVRSMITFGLHATGSRFLYNFYTHADYLIVGKMFGDDTLGIYTIAYRVVFDPLKTMAGLVNRVAYPAFARVQDDLINLRFYFFSIARGSLLLIGTVLVVVAVYFESILLATGYDKYLGALPYVRVFVLIGAFRCVTPLIPQLLNAVGWARANFYYSLITAIVMPLAFYVGARQGALAVAWAWVVAYPAVAAILFVLGRRALKVSWMTFLIGSFAGLAPLALVCVSGWGVREWTSSLGPGWRAILGIAATLTATIGLVLWRERGLVNLLRRRAT